MNEKFYTRDRICSIEEVFNFLGDDINKTCSTRKGRILKEFDEGITVRTNSQRYAVFHKDLKCSCCGIEGKYFALEKVTKQPGKNFHFNLYAIDENGNEVLMTKDHIIPKSKGGEDILSNYQTMCVNCNTAKGDK